MIRQTIALLLCALTTNAWSIVGRAGSSSGRRITGVGSLLAANIGSTLSMANNNVDGECAVTPEIPAAETSSSAIDTSSSLKRKPKAGDVVTFTLLRFQPESSCDDDNNLVLEPLFDTTGTLQLVLDGGNYLPGLHKLLSTMNPGETIQRASIDAGYGGFNPQLVFQISTSDIGSSLDTSLVKIGTVLQMGNGMNCRVTEMDDEKWTLDANHVLAGASYEADVKLEKVEEGPKNWEYVAELAEDGRYKVATFALGCFWGGELAYQRMPGVISTHVGYTQGKKENPTYEEVCTGTTGHTEAIRVIYDPNVVSYKSLVQLGLDRLGGDIYKLNQVGNDRGTQYRHGIYYHNEEQKKVAEELLNQLSDDTKEVFTEVKEAKVFYMAEDYHQQYLLKGGQSAKKGASETIRCYG